MFCQLIIIAFFATCVSSGIVGNYVDCGSTSIIYQFRISGCDSMPCVLTTGHTYTIEMDVNAGSLSNALPYSVYGGPANPIYIKEGDACDDLIVGKCPFLVGQSYTYQYVFDIPSNFPQTNTRFAAKVKDDNGGVVICVQLDVRIRKPQKSNS